MFAHLTHPPLARETFSKVRCCVSRSLVLVVCRAHMLENLQAYASAADPLSWRKWYPVALPRASATALGLVGFPGCTGQAKPSATFAGDFRRRFPASCIDRRLTRRRESSVFQASGKRRKPGKQDLGRIGHLTRFSLSNGPKLADSGQFDKVFLVKWANRPI